jgi:protein SDA1
LRVGKKTRKRQKRTEKALKAVRRDKKSKNNEFQNLIAINLIYDPQDFAEKLFKLVETTGEGFEFKLSVLELISILIGVHSLFLNNFHSYLIRFLNPHQRGKERDLNKAIWQFEISFFLSLKVLLAFFLF